MAHSRGVERAVSGGRFAAKTRPALTDHVRCTRCAAPDLCRSDFHPRDVRRNPNSWCKRCSVAVAKEWRHKNRDRAILLGKRGNLKANYGITVEHYDRLFAAQAGKCAICEGPGTRALAVDHSHETGEIRGLLCDSCNNGIGRFRDDPGLLRKAADYLTLDKNDGHKSAESSRVR